MSGTGYQDPSCVKTAICSKCEGYKTWNYWFHHDDSLCDDCYYLGGRYKNLTKEEAMKLEKDNCVEDLFGMYAHKKYGFYSGLIGKIGKSDSGFTPYKLVDPKGETICGFTKRGEIVLVEMRE